MMSEIKQQTATNTHLNCFSSQTPSQMRCITVDYQVKTLYDSSESKDTVWLPEIIIFI